MFKHENVMYIKISNLRKGHCKKRVCEHYQKMLPFKILSTIG